MTNKEQLDSYLNSLEKGDNITITADFLDTLKAVSNELKAIELYKEALGKKIERVLKDIEKETDPKRKEVYLAYYQGVMYAYNFIKTIGDIVND